MIRIPTLYLAFYTTGFLEKSVSGKLLAYRILVTSGTLQPLFSSSPAVSMTYLKT